MSTNYKLLMLCLYISVTIKPDAADAIKDHTCPNGGNSLLYNDQPCIVLCMNELYLFATQSHHSRFINLKCLFEFIHFLKFTCLTSQGITTFIKIYENFS